MPCGVAKTRSKAGAKRAAPLFEPGEDRAAVVAQHHDRQGGASLAGADQQPVRVVQEGQVADEGDAASRVRPTQGDPDRRRDHAVEPRPAHGCRRQSGAGAVAHGVAMTSRSRTGLDEPTTNVVSAVTARPTVAATASGERPCVATASSMRAASRSSASRHDSTHPSASREAARGTASSTLRDAPGVGRDTGATTHGQHLDRRVADQGRDGARQGGVPDHDDPLDARAQRRVEQQPVGAQGLAADTGSPRSARRAVASCRPRRGVERLGLRRRRRRRPCAGQGPAPRGRRRHPGRGPARWSDRAGPAASETGPDSSGRRHHSPGSTSAGSRSPSSCTLSWVGPSAAQAATAAAFNVVWAGARSQVVARPRTRRTARPARWSGWRRSREAGRAGRH